MNDPGSAELGKRYAQLVGDTLTHDRMLNELLTLKRAYSDLKSGRDCSTASKRKHNRFRFHGLGTTGRARRFHHRCTKIDTSDATNHAPKTISHGKRAAAGIATRSAMG